MPNEKLHRRLLQGVRAAIDLGQADISGECAEQLRAACTHLSRDDLTGARRLLWGVCGRCDTPDRRACQGQLIDVIAAINEAVGGFEKAVDQQAFAQLAALRATDETWEQYCEQRDAEQHKKAGTNPKSAAAAGEGVPLAKLKAVELKSIATALGFEDADGMVKRDLVEAIEGAIEEEDGGYEQLAFEDLEPDQLAALARHAGVLADAEDLAGAVREKLT